MSLIYINLYTSIVSSELAQYGWMHGLYCCRVFRTLSFDLFIDHITIIDWSVVYVLKLSFLITVLRLVCFFRIHYVEPNISYVSNFLRVRKECTLFCTIIFTFKAEDTISCYIPSPMITYQSNSNFLIMTNHSSGKSLEKFSAF